MIQEDNKRNKKHRFWRITAAAAGVLVLSVFLSYLWSTYGLTTSHYTVTSDKLTRSFRVVSLADIHGRVFGKENKRLIRHVQQTEPDLILIAGDLVDKNTKDITAEEELVRELCRIAPVYLSPGNHELEYDKKHETVSGSVLKQFEEAGAVILDRTYEDIKVNGQEIRLGGIYGYVVPEEFSNDWLADEVPYLKDFEDTDRFKMLLCHMPYSFLVAHSLEHWQFDTVLSGHVHGGQVRFPFFSLLSKYKTGKEDDTFPYWGGLWAPDQGRFPGRLSGVYYSKDKQRTMILSRGLGNTDWMPRINNIPEIVVVDYGPAEAD